MGKHLEESETLCILGLSNPKSFNCCFRQSMMPDVEADGALRYVLLPNITVTNNL